MNQFSTLWGASTLKRMTLALLFLSIVSFAQAATYFLTAAGAGSAQTPGSWNTNPAGGGTAATNFTTSGDIFNIPSNINGVATASFVFGSTSGANLVMNIDGSLTLNSGV